MLAMTKTGGNGDIKQCAVKERRWLAAYRRRVYVLTLLSTVSSQELLLEALAQSPCNACAKDEECAICEVNDGVGRLKGWLAHFRRRAC